MSKEFKVGDKVSHPEWGKGEVKGTGGYGEAAVCVRFEGAQRRDVYFTSDGRYFKEDITPTLYHGHGTFEIQFTPEPEPVYEWQWRMRDKRDGRLAYTQHYKTETTMRGNWRQEYWEIVDRDESTKREVKP